MTRTTAAPSGLMSLCASVGFERSAYYGLQSILALYLARSLLVRGDISAIWLLPQLSSLTGAQGVGLAAVITGLFMSLAAVAPVFGALVADRLIGQHRAIMTGGLMMAAGHGLLMIEAALLPALVAIAIGSGLFKGPIAAQLSSLYAADDDRRVEGFRLFYVMINLAGLVAPLVIGTAAERVHWHAGFALACLSMVIGLVVYSRRFPSESGARLTPLRSEDAGPPTVVPAGIGTIAILGFSTAAIMVPNFQIANAYLLWVDRAFDLAWFGWRLPTSAIIAVDGLLGLVALAATGLFWRGIEKRRGTFAAASKAAIGAVFVVAGSLCLVLAAKVHGDAKVALVWGLAFQLLNSLGLANVLPAVMAMFGQMAASRFAATAMAGFYLSVFAGGLATTALASQFGALPLATFWLIHSGCAVAGMSGLIVSWHRANSRRAIGAHLLATPN